MDSHEFFTQPSTACHEIPGALASEGDEYMMITYTLALYVVTVRFLGYYN
jgi:hypothetical protein